MQRPRGVQGVNEPVFDIAIVLLGGRSAATEVQRTDGAALTAPQARAA